MHAYVYFEIKKHIYFMRMHIYVPITLIPLFFYIIEI
jgi:hypothetical protein